LNMKKFIAVFQCAALAIVTKLISDNAGDHMNQLNLDFFVGLSCLGFYLIYKSYKKREMIASGGFLEV